MIIPKKGLTLIKHNIIQDLGWAAQKKNSPNWKIQIWVLLGCRTKLRFCSFIVVWSYRLDMKCIWLFCSHLCCWVGIFFQWHSCYKNRGSYIYMSYGSILWTCDSVVAVSSSCFDSRFTDLVEYLCCSAYMSSDVPPARLQNTHHSFRVSDVGSQRDVSTLKWMCNVFFTETITVCQIPTSCITLKLWLVIEICHFYLTFTFL